MTHDLLGRPLEEMEREVLVVYEGLKRLAAREDAPPCLNANACFALASVWQIVNDLDLLHELETD